MTASAHILIADDEETFAHATADLLRREGYLCEVVGDAAGARAALKLDEFDLLVADIRMPGNHQFELIRDVPSLAPGLPVIVVTAFPSLTSAVASVELPVTGYLMKPLDVGALLERVRAAVGQRRAVRAVEAQHARVEAWLRELDHMRLAMRGTPRDPQLPPASAFTTMTLQHVSATLAELRRMGVAGGQADAVDTCALVGCAQRGQLVATLREVIDVLQRTKGAFKSRELGSLRRKVEQVVAGVTAA